MEMTDDINRDFPVLYIFLDDKKSDKFPTIYMFPDDRDVLFKLKKPFHLEITERKFRLFKERRHKKALLMNTVNRTTTKQAHIIYLECSDTLSVWIIDDYKCRPLTETINLLINNSDKYQGKKQKSSDIIILSIMQMNMIYKLIGEGKKQEDCYLSILPQPLLDKIMIYWKSPSELWDTIS